MQTSAVALSAGRRTKSLSMHTHQRIYTQRCSPAQHHSFGTESVRCEWSAVIQSNKAAGNFISRVQNHKAHFISAGSAWAVSMVPGTACYICPGIIEPVLLILQIEASRRRGTRTWQVIPAAAESQKLILMQPQLTTRNSDRGKISARHTRIYEAIRQALREKEGCLESFIIAIRRWVIRSSVRERWRSQLLIQCGLFLCFPALCQR